MCRTYGSGETAYVRACYRTGHAGQKVAASQAVWRGSHLDLSGAATGSLMKPVGTMQHYRIPRESVGAVVAQVVERYRPVNTPEPVEIDGAFYVSFHFKKPLPEMTERMATFGWRLVPHVDGLPTPPMREAKPRRSGGRPFMWALVVIFDQEPTADTLAAITEAAQDDSDRRDFYHGKAGKWVRHGFRNRGWNRKEWDDLWALIRSLGGREWQKGDDPVG